MIRTIFIEAKTRIPFPHQRHLYGDIPPRTYPRYAREKIYHTFGTLQRGNPAHDALRTERMILWENYRGLVAYLDALEDCDDIVATVYAYIADVNEFARDQLVHTPPEGLGRHLQEVTTYAQNLLLIHDQEGQAESRFPDILSTHQAELVTHVVAPMHDVLKFLGNPAAQVIPDHEVITAELVRQCFPGKNVVLGNRSHTLSHNDAEFIADIISDHENIEKEEGRTGYISSQKPTERAKAAFFIIDILTGALEPTERGTFHVNHAQLEKRFADLYFRHIDLVTGKMFRPEWGVYTVADINHTLGVLMQHGLEVEGDTQPSEAIRQAALHAIERALHADALRRDQENGPTFTPQQREAIHEAQEALMGGL